MELKINFKDLAVLVGAIATLCDTGALPSFAVKGRLFWWDT